MDEQLTTVQDFSVRIHFEKILETISTRIYDSQYAFLRENVQNAIDAIRIQATRDGMQTDAPKYRIDVRALFFLVGLSGYLALGLPSS